MERYLRQCVDSVLAQTFTDFELLLVDDGSTDASPAICDSYAAADPRVRVIHKPNTGVADTRNVAVAAARGRFVGFVDSDDWIAPAMYATLYNAITEHDADIAVCGYTFEWRDRSKPRHDGSTPVKVYSHDEALAAVFADTPLQSMLCDKLFRREVMTETFPTGYFFEDHATVIKWFAHARKVVFDPRSFYHYRMRGGSTVNGDNPERRYHFLVAEMERARFLRSIGFLDSKDPCAGASRILTVALGTAKNIARSSAPADVRSSYLRKIVREIQPWLPAAGKVLARRQRGRLARLLGSVSWFTVSVRFSKLFGFGRKRKIKNLFP